MIYKSIPEIEQIFLGSTAIGKIFNGSDLVFEKDNDPYSGQYIIFSDPDVKSIIVSYFGDTSIGEITYGQAAAVTEFFSDPYYWGFHNGTQRGPFIKNTYIETFDEFTYFTGVSYIARQLFSGCYLTSVVLPSYITEIDVAAFENSHLESIDIPSYVTSIGHGAFWECSYLESVTFGNSLSYIDEGAFYNCNSLKTAHIPDSVTYIGGSAFAGCSELEENLTLPNIITINGNAFGGCSSLSSVTFGNSLKTIGNQAFVGCSGLTGTLSIPNGVTSIGYSAFEGCSGLTGTLTIPNSITSIGSSTFAGCNGLSSVIIPSSVTTIGQAVFHNCQNLESITCKATTPPTLQSSSAFVTVLSGGGYNNYPIYVPAASVDAYKAASQWSNLASRIQAIPTNISFADNDVKTILVNKYGSNGQITDAQAAAVTTFMSGTNKTNNPFFENGNVEVFTEFRYFTGITAIGDYTFALCSNMGNITIPANVTSIGEGAFTVCETLEAVTIPAAVTSIGDMAFDGCTGLSSITCNATTPPTLGYEVFRNTNNCPIYVPSASVSAYKTSWSDYASRIQAIS